MTEINDICKDLKSNFKPRKKDAKIPVKSWNEKDVLNEKIVDTFVIILKTYGCSWAHKSGCSMCGYYNDSQWETIDKKDLIEQFENAMKNYSNQKFVKIFTSGSFLDENEIHMDVKNAILHRLSATTEKISVESRPEYVTNTNLSESKAILNDTCFEIGIGLETSDDFVRKNMINKGFSFNDYKKASEIIKKNNCEIKTYLLMKPPFLTEEQSINDCINSIDQIKDITNLISLNPTNIQRGTYVEYLWKRDQYRPPWLWSVIKVLNEGKKLLEEKRIKCDISGGGGKRGANNCIECNRNILDKISKFSLTQDLSLFNNLNCNCYDKWQNQLELEEFGFGSLVDIDGMKRYARNS